MKVFSPVLIALVTSLVISVSAFLAILSGPEPSSCHNLEIPPFVPVFIGAWVAVLVFALDEYFFGDGQ